MPTVEEALQDTVETIAKAMAHDCYICQGKGRLAAPGEGEEVTLEDGRTAYVFEKVRCETCGGLGKMMPDPCIVMQAALTAVVCDAYRSLHDSDFDRCHRAIEWGFARWREAMATVSAEDFQDGLDQLSKAAGEDPFLPPKPTTPNPTALSPAELAELLGESPQDPEGS